jgi:hypothetical protein
MLRQANICHSARANHARPTSHIVAESPSRDYLVSTNETRRRISSRRRCCKQLSSNNLLYWGGWIRTTDLLINSQALCQLSYTPNFVPLERER